MKVVICVSHGGFRLSEKAIRWLKVRGYDYEDTEFYHIDRTHPLLIEAVGELGKECGTSCSELKIIEIPDDIKWCIEDYDGKEWVAECHRTWGRYD